MDYDRKSPKNEILKKKDLEFAKNIFRKAKIILD